MIRLNRKFKHELKRKRLSKKLHAQALENKAYNKAALIARDIQVRAKVMELRKKNEVQAKKSK